MILITHITIAITSVIYSLYTYAAPSDSKLRIASWLIAGVVGSGTVLVVSLQANLVRACLTGLLFVGFSAAGVLAAKRKLALEVAREDH